MKWFEVDMYYVPVMPLVGGLIAGYLFVKYVKVNNVDAALALALLFIVGSMGLGVVAASEGWVPTEGGALHTVLMIGFVATSASFITAIVLYAKRITIGKSRPNGAVTLGRPNTGAQRQDTGAYDFDKN